MSPNYQSSQSETAETVQMKLDGLELKYAEIVIEEAKKHGKLSQLHQMLRIFYESELKQAP